MPKMTIEDLKRIKEAHKGVMNLRDGDQRVKVTVHMGTCGIAAGARGVMTTLVEALRESGANDVILTSSGCAGLCSQEPMMTVEIRDTAPVKYIQLDEAKTKEIFEQHILNGEPVHKHALAVGSETTY